MEKKTIKVLVVVDMQNDFIDGSLGTKEAQAIVPNVVKKIEEFDGDAIFVTRDTHEKNYLYTPEGKKLPVEHCIRNTEGWELNKDIKEALFNVDRGETKDKNLWYINKPTFGSYALITDVLDLVADKEANNIFMDIEVCGLCTDICVVSNVLMLKAYTYDCAEITVDASCCAGVTPETHRAALTTMKMCQINVINDEG